MARGRCSLERESKSLTLKEGPRSQMRSNSSTQKRLGQGWGLRADAEGAGAEEVGARSRMVVVAIPVTQGPGEAPTPRRRFRLLQAASRFAGMQHLKISHRSGVAGSDVRPRDINGSMEPARVPTLGDCHSVRMSSPLSLTATPPPKALSSEPGVWPTDHSLKEGM